jgi:hypothetical protein
MPGFGTELGEQDRWVLVDFLSANAAAALMRQGEGWDNPVAAPDTPMVCNGSNVASATELCGAVLHLLAVAPGEGSQRSPIPPQGGIAVITLYLAGSNPEPGACVAVDRAWWIAYATLFGITPEELAGSDILADPQGPLRVWWRSGSRPSTELLIKAIRLIWAQPLAVQRKEITTTTEIRQIKTVPNQNHVCLTRLSRRLSVSGLENEASTVETT